MKNFIVPVFLLASVQAFPQHWQQHISYSIDITLNTQEKSLNGFEEIIYTNNSPDTLLYIWFHIWPNAYRNDQTAFSDQHLENGATDFYFSSREERGYINRMEFRVDGITAMVEDHPQHIDIMKVLLPEPLFPGSRVTITTPFHIRLPRNISRGGYSGESIQATQWYPKPAMYDQQGWHPMPYLDQGEFYSNFGSFDVRITVPASFVVAATGELQNQAEANWLHNRKRVPEVRDTGMKTLRFVQDRVHDFAWFASPDYIVDMDTCRLPSGRIILAETYYTAGQSKLWQNALQYAKDAVWFYSAEVGEYPYNTVTVVSGPQGAGGGMEYPTITLIAPMPTAKMLDIVIAHEIGHNWFQGILASNEREYPWMDEGMNSFYEKKYTTRKYGSRDQFEEILLQTRIIRRTDQPITTRSQDFSSLNYGLVAYTKTALWMQLLEKRLGEEEFRKMMQEYYELWKFRHPAPADFRAVAEKRLGNDTEELFRLLDEKGMLPGQKYSGFRILSLFRPSTFREYARKPSGSALLILPAPGYNSHDGFMLGLALGNYKLPPDRLQMLATPMYAFGSGELVGLARLNYSFHSNGPVRRTELFMNAARFSMRDYEDMNGSKTHLQFSKLVPGLRFTFANRDPRSQLSRYIQWKTFFISEEFLRFRFDTVFTGPDTLVNLRHTTLSSGRYLNQLRIGWANDRALYPFDMELQVEQAEDFIRPAFTARYFFNYPRDGGLSVRFFAGKFIYRGERTISKQFSTDRYHLNMTGPNGFEDYTYSSYFAGRGRFEGFASQQIMIRDGAFKLRTDLLAEKIGKTDDWLMAMNFNSIVPKSINPLSMLPVKIPLHIFLDIGTYAAVWQPNATDDRFLFNAGFHIPLLGGIANLYMPLFYNTVFSDYVKSTVTGNRFFKTISFSIDLDTRQIRKTLNQIEP